MGSTVFVFGEEFQFYYDLSEETCEKHNAAEENNTCTQISPDVSKR